MRIIAWLDELDQGALSLAGGKGANLGAMVRAKLPVPPGFVVTTDAYRAQVESSGLNGALTPEIAAQVAAAYRALATRAPSAKVAVRSSATAEDLPDASFAGQQETFLDVSGEEAVLEAVRRCWASLWAPRSVAYRERMGYAKFEVSLAVVVQAMVPADAAGVLFTANPMTGKADEFLINASYGLGEAVVSGLVTPDMFLLNAQGKVVRKVLGSKEQRIVPGLAGTQAEPVEPEERNRFCLSDDDLARLADLGRQASAFFGAPQDIEWAFAGGELYLLQARPITVAALGYVGPKLSRWELRAHAAAADNNLDHWSEPMKPLDAAFYRVATKGMGHLLNELGGHVPPDRQYYEELPDGRIAIRPIAPLPRLPMLWRAPGRMRRALHEDPGAHWARLRAELLAVLDPLARQVGAAVSAQVLAQGISTVLAALEREMPERMSSVFSAGVLHEAMVRLWCRLALGKEAGAQAVLDLSLALPYRTAEMNRAVARLARTALQHGKASPAFRQAFEAFVAEWGSRPTRGMEAMPSVPTWREEPSAIIGLVDATLSDPAAMEVETLQQRQEAQFAETRDRVAARLRPSFRRRFLHSVEMMRRYIMAREDSLLVHERAVSLMRRFALELGSRLVEASRIVAADDVFFLLESELGPAARGERDLQERIARRQRAYQQVAAAHRRGENWLVASGSLPEEAFPRRAPSGNELLKGLPASRGRASGRVCIVRDQSEFGKVKKGDILVAPVTAPAWTPLFRIAAAVVTDVGGPLSHAAIVAREYGIPAVLGTGSAARRLTDGQLVTVDGTVGAVLALDEGAQ